jgi:hypothetical protein
MISVSGRLFCLRPLATLPYCIRHAISRILTVAIFSDTQAFDNQELSTHQSFARVSHASFPIKPADEFINNESRVTPALQNSHQYLQ